MNGRVPMVLLLRWRHEYGQKTGGYRWFLIRDNPLRDKRGLVLRWYGTRTDIEDRKRAEEALLSVASERLRSEQIRPAGAEEAARAGEERFRAVADSLPEPFTEERAGCVRCISIACQPFGHRPDVLTGPN